MPELGIRAPDFHLTDVVSGRRLELSSFESKDALLVMFVACHCPFSGYVRHELAHLASDYADRSLGIVAICASDVAQHPEDGPEGLRNFARQLNSPFPVCHDETQAVARAFQAACTPDFFLFDGDRKLAYRGRLDDSRPGNPPPVVTGKDLRKAIDAVLAGRMVDGPQQPSMGCNIKWKPGNEPLYYAAGRPA